VAVTDRIITSSPSFSSPLRTAPTSVYAWSVIPRETWTGSIVLSEWSFQTIADSAFGVRGRFWTPVLASAPVRAEEVCTAQGVTPCGGSPEASTREKFSTHAAFRRWIGVDAGGIRAVPRHWCPRVSSVSGRLRQVHVMALPGIELGSPITSAHRVP
jgi:hypothetical protein